MPEDSTTPLVGARRLEDIALDLMKFIAMTTGYGKSPTGPAAGFQARPERSEEHAETLLQLYQRCRAVVEGKERS